jgi:hypothetical protein
MTDAKPRAAIRTQTAQREVWEQRTELVKKEMAAASAANDAKTVRLKALRLEKERQDAEAAAQQGAGSSAPAAAPKRARIRRISVT